MTFSLTPPINSNYLQEYDYSNSDDDTSCLGPREEWGGGETTPPPSELEYTPVQEQEGASLSCNDNSIKVREQEGGGESLPQSGHEGAPIQEHTHNHSVLGALRKEKERNLTSPGPQPRSFNKRFKSKSFNRRFARGVHGRHWYSCEAGIKVDGKTLKKWVSKFKKTRSLVKATPEARTGISGPYPSCDKTLILQINLGQGGELVNKPNKLLIKVKEKGVRGTTPPPRN